MQQKIFTTLGHGGRFFALGALTAVLLLGCNKKPPTEPEPQAETAARIPTNCDDASIKNALVRRLATDISAHIDQLVDAYPKQKDLDLGRLTQKRLNELNIDLQNARVQGESCLIDVIAPLPASDVSYADRHFATTDAPSVERRAEQMGVATDNNQLIIEVAYTTTDGVVALAAPAPALGLFAETMVASAYTMAQKESRVDTAGRPAIRITPAEPILTARAPQENQNGQTQSAASNETNSLSDRASENRSDSDSDDSNAPTSASTDSRTPLAFAPTAVPQTPPPASEGQSDALDGASDE